MDDSVATCLKLFRYSGVRWGGSMYDFYMFIVCSNIGNYMHIIESMFHSTQRLLFWQSLGLEDLEK